MQKIRYALAAVLFSSILLSSTACTMSADESDASPSIVISQQVSEIAGTELEVFTYNNSVPGPLLKATKNEELSFLFHNRLPVETSVHFHGIIPSNANDGVPLITQDPIGPGEYFRYNLTFPHSGLFWYHSHTDGYEQVERGLQAPFLVREERPALPEESEIIYVMDDLLLEDGDWYPFSTQYVHGRGGNVLTINGDKFQINTVPTDVARLRLVNTANAQNAIVTFGGKRATVIGKDLEFGKPYNTTEVLIPPAGRVDLLVHGNKTDPTIIYRKIRGGLSRMAYIYHGEEEAEIDWPMHDDFGQLREKFLSKPTAFDISMSGFRTREGLRWSFDGKTFPDDPLTHSLPKGNHTVEIINTQMQPHPIHFHGMRFMILERNGVPVEDNFWYDTVHISGHERVKIGLVVEDEGNWAFHCHILEHADAGMLGLLTVE